VERRPALGGGRGPADPLHRGGQVAALIHPNRQGRASLIVLGCIWGAILALHVALHLGDILLWIGFPLLFLPWILLGGSNWFDR
jgi:hypothetical protein